MVGFRILFGYFLFFFSFIEADMGKTCLFLKKRLFLLTLHIEIENRDGKLSLVGIETP